jgi:hypothetical protein
MLVELEGAMESELTLRIIRWLIPGVAIDWWYCGGYPVGEGKANC